MATTLQARAKSASMPAEVTRMKEEHQRPSFESASSIERAAECSQSRASIRASASASDELFSIYLSLEEVPSSAPFTFHSDLLSSCSAGFKRLIDCMALYRGKVSINLEDEDKETMDSFKTWLYTGNLNYSEQKAAHLKPMPVALLCKLWAFGCMWLIPALQNACIDELHRQLHKKTTDSPYDHFAFIDKCIPPESGLWRLFLDVTMHFGIPLKDSQLSCATGGLYMMLLQQLLQAKQDPWADTRVSQRLKSSCSYHEHGADHVCNAVGLWTSVKHDAGIATISTNQEQPLLQYLPEGIAAAEYAYFELDICSSAFLFEGWSKRSFEEQRLVD